MRKRDLVYIWTAPHGDKFWFFKSELPEDPVDFSVFDVQDGDGLVFKKYCEFHLPREYAS